MPSRELEIPPDSVANPSAQEMARIWLNDGNADYSLQPALLEQPEGWGIVLADLVRNLADAYHKQKGLNQEETAAKIFMMLIAEVQEPTADNTGDFVGGK